MVYGGLLLPELGTGAARSGVGLRGPENLMTGRW
jgi:hypothetical protein